MAANIKSNFLSEAILEESLVDLWPDYPCLYDVRSPEFKDRVKRDSAIHEIAEKLEQEGECPPDNPIHFTIQYLAKFVLWFSLFAKPYLGETTKKRREILAWNGQYFFLSISLFLLKHTYVYARFVWN